MYRNTSVRPRRHSAFSSSRRGKYNNNNRNRGKKRGQTIDSRRFIKAAKPVEQVSYTPTHRFEDFALHELIQENLQTLGFTLPTKIQNDAIPVVSTGQDVVGIANTGTGKTAAFLLPTLTKILNDKQQKVLIVAPTRELAQQIAVECRSFAKHSKLSDALLIGGVPIRPQLRDLSYRPNIIIGTPGRIKDHLERGTLQLHQVNTVVLDEVDRMLDMGFINDIRLILSKLPESKQSLFFSATMSNTIETLVRTFTHEPEVIMARTAETSDNVDQSVIEYRGNIEKIDKLHTVLNLSHAEKTLIFCETKRSTENLSKELAARGFKTDAMHGNKSQGQRQRALKKFKSGEASVLVATDVAARGIDVDGITHVVNYDIPQTYDDYTHRIGRTGRGSNTGYAITFVSN